MKGSRFLTARKKLPETVITQLLHEVADDSGAAVRQLANCLIPLLNSLGWRGDPRHVAESVPHFASDLDLDGFRNVLANLNFASEPHRVDQAEIDPALTPCLFIPDKGTVRVVLSETDDGWSIFDGDTCQLREDKSASLPGTAYYISESTMRTDPESIGYRSWMGRVGRRLRIIAWQALFITLVFNLLSIVTPLFIMSLYDSVIPSGSVTQLYFLLIGIAGAVALEMGFRTIRSRSLAYAAGRMDHLVGTATFQQVTFLPALQTESAPLGTQIARLKEFEVVRDFFTGPLSEAVLDLPFALIFIAVIAALGGPLALIPVVVAVLFAILAVCTAPMIRRLHAKASGLRSEQQHFLVEALGNLRNIKMLSAKDLWLERHRRMSAEGAETDFRASMINHGIQTISNTLMLGAGVALIGFGAVLVMNQEMTSGALIAVMILGWRALSPLQSAFAALSRAEQIRAAITQINKLMRLPVERIPGDVPPLRSVGGGIMFSFVSFRYAPTSDPALYSASFTAEPGQVVAVTGPNGSGKSTILKLAAGIHRPQAGAVLIDGVDLRQLDAIDLRQRIGMVPQTAQFFHGTIAQNLRMSVPTANESNLIDATKKAQIYDDIMALPEKFDTRLTDSLLSELSTGFKRKLSLARAYLRRAPVLILDEPSQALDREGDEALMKAIKEARGNTTVLMSTHRPSHMRLADRLIVMHAGRIAFDGTPDEFFERQKEHAA